MKSSNSDLKSLVQGLRKYIQYYKHKYSVIFVDKLAVAHSFWLGFCFRRDCGYKMYQNLYPATGKYEAYIVLIKTLPRSKQI
jgi:hypothetical protein